MATWVTESFIITQEYSRNLSAQKGENSDSFIQPRSVS